MNRRINSLSILVLGTIFFKLVCPVCATNAVSPATLNSNREIIVKFKPGTIKARKSAIHASLSAVSLDSSKIPNTELVLVPEGQTVESTLSAYKDNPDVEYVQPNYTYTVPSVTVKKTFAVTPNDPYYSSQTAFDIIQLPQAWDISTGHSSVVVAIVGTGINYNHPDLGQGFGPGFRVIDGYDFVNDDADPMDEIDGSTLSAGLIGAVTNNSVGVAGINWHVRFIACKAYHNSSKRGNSYSFASGINYAINKSANIIQSDLTQEESKDDPIVREAVEKAVINGIPVVAHAGSSGSITTLNYPAQYGGVFAVGSINASNNPTSFPAPEIMVVAPNIATALLTSLGSSYVYGTTDLIPLSLVTGVCALLQSVKYRLSPETLRSVLTSTADDVYSVGIDSYTGYGRINAFRAIQKVQSLVSRDAEGSTVPMPNPFIVNRMPAVTLSIPNTFGTTGLTVRIYDVAGTLVRALNGTNRWDGKNESGVASTSGIYFYELKTDAGTVRGRLTLIQ